MELDKIYPTLPEFTINEKIYHLKLVSVADQVWLSEKLGGMDKVQLMFHPTNPDLGAIIKFSYRLLQEKQDFLAKDVETINDEGETLIRRMSGPEVMMTAMKPHEITGIVEALKESFEKSNPVKQAESIKKKTAKSVRNELQTGQKS